MEKGKPKDQHWSQYKKRSIYLSTQLDKANKKLETIKDLHKKKMGICIQCTEIYPCETMKIIKK